ncbi:Uncharacterised protein [Mycobacterium tuberculosis]|nr:Uncharacterised protein [Mycobacterium tuberculosis]
MVVRPKTPRGDGNPRRASTRGCRLRWSSDPKPREGTETGSRQTGSRRSSPVVRPKTPRGDGNPGYLLPARGDAVRGRQTQNPERGRKPHCANWLGADPGGRQTQNPERGRKPCEQRRRQPGGHGAVVRPKTPRGDGNRMDPGELQMVREVVRPKTPRGDGNRFASDRFASIKSGRQTQNPERGRKPPRRLAITTPTNGRQTQNPERGRKPHIDFLDLARREDHVVRPKTPREDGNSSTIASMSMSQSSSRQTQNPERGRKLHIDFLDLARREDHVVRPKTPREDGNSSTIASMSMSQSSSRQTQNPERGRKLGACHRRRHD